MANSAYVNLWNKLDENFTTAPKDPDGNPQPSFMKYLELVYTLQEAELLQHMQRPGQFITTQEVADSAGKPLDYVKEVLDGAYRRGGLIGKGDFYSLPTMPMLLNHHHVYPEIKPDDLEAAELYQDFFIKDKFSLLIFKPTPFLIKNSISKASLISLRFKKASILLFIISNSDTVCVNTWIFECGL